MRSKTLVIGVIGVVIGLLLAAAGIVLAGSLKPSVGPSGSTSQLYTLQQVYDRLNAGTAATKMSTITEPSSGPGSTMKNLDDLYTLASERSRPAKTGQTTSYATHDDGALQKGVAWPNPRFTDNSNGTVTDNLTGLMWMKNADAGNDCAGADTGTETWANALASAAACNTATYAGYTDWRLPNMREMQSLVHYGFSSPAVPNTAGTAKWTSGNPFTGVQSNIYCTSTTRADSTLIAWGMHLNGGDSTTGGKGNTCYVWPVRGGQ